MFRNLFQRAPEFDAPIAPEVPFFALGDVHGRIDLFERLLRQVDEAGPKNVHLICVGDYIDRGDHAARVLFRLHELAQDTGSWLTCLMGNHEQMMIDMLDDPARAGPRWLRHGGLQTLASFGLSPVRETAPPEAWTEARDALREALGAPLETWLRRLPMIWRSGNVAVTHAGANPAARLSDQQRQHLLWGHPEFHRTLRTDGNWVVHGHTIVDEPSAEAGRIAIDTGAYATGRLTAALIEPGNVSFLST